MTIYLNIYIFFYIINLLSLHLILNHIFGTNKNILSLQQMTYYILKYSKLKLIYYALIVALTGLPPFLLFFAKFNFLIESYTHIGFSFFYVVFLTICVNMFFYTQPIIIKNVNFDSIIPNFTEKPISHKELCIIVFFLSTSIFSVFFFPDLCISATIAF